MSSMSESVWDRTASRFGGGSGEMSKNAFAALVCFWTAAGIAVSAVCAYAAMDWRLPWYAYLALAIVPFVGVFVSLGSKNPLVSLFGYALIVVPFGLITGPMVAMYTAASVVKVFAITTGLVVTLGFIGAIYPKSLESWGIYLLGALFVLIFGQLIVMVAGMFGANVGGAMTVFDWIGVVLFSAYVVYDLNRAMRVERTHDNAIDCAVAIYLDFLNLFLRLLRLLGQRKN
jgi:FtsH-binding integral membrane protein